MGRTSLDFLHTSIIHGRPFPFVSISSHFSIIVVDPTILHSGIGDQHRTIISTEHICMCPKVVAVIFLPYSTTNSHRRTCVWATMEWIPLVDIIVSLSSAHSFIQRSLTLF